MAPVPVTVDNFNLEKLDPKKIKNADLFKAHKQMQVDMMIKSGRDQVVPDYPEEAPIQPATEEGKFVPPPPDVTNVTDEQLKLLAKKLADEEAKKQKELDLKNATSVPGPLKDLTDIEKEVQEREMKMKQDEDAAKEEEKKKAELERLKALNLGNEIFPNPIAKVKLGAQIEYQGGKDTGYKAETVKFRLAQDLHLPEFNKVLKPAKALDIDFDKLHWDSEEGENILAVCWYVCVNGPVGVNKATRFGTLPGRFSIAGLFKKAGYPVTVTNSMWKKFCRKMVEHIDMKKPEIRDCAMIRRFGELWPLCDSAMVTQSEYKKFQQQESLKVHGKALKEYMQ